MKAKFASTAAVGTVVLLVGMTLMAQNTPSRSVWDGVYSEEQAGRGEASYGEQCGSCHGGGLEGTEVSPALTGYEFLGTWGGLTVGDLFERIRTTMPLNKPGSLSRDANADIVAYLLSFNKFPAGVTPLPASAPALQLIRIDATKPN